MSSLAAYLAKNYLTASTTARPDTRTSGSRPKKRRKRDSSSTAYSGTNGGLIVADDDASLSLAASRQRSKNARYDSDEDQPIYDNANGSMSAEFRRAKKNNWKPVTEDSSNTDGQTADRLVAQAIADDAARKRQVQGEDGPTIVDVGVSTPRTEPEELQQQQRQKKLGGIQTAEDTRRLEAATAATAEHAPSKKARKAAAKAEAEQTVYRDATGRRIDISMRRAELREAEEEKRRKDKEGAMGEVQKQEKQEKRQAIADARFLGVARYADDESMNDEMKAVGRWGDPMLGYVREKERQASEDDEESPGRGVARSKKNLKTSKHGLEIGGSATTSTTKKREYQGAAAPNRYGIRPGWRWDGVDRGNGFEKDWFQARGRKSRIEHLEYQWQMDE